MTETEYATGAALDGWKSLSRASGLKVETIGRMAIAGELRGLFDTTTGNLLSQAELRSRFGGPRPAPAKAIAALERMSGRQALNEIMRKRPLVDPRTELLRLQAKRRAWATA